MRGNTFDLVVLWVAAVGQILFVLLWATQLWWASNIGRALMAKSAFLAILLAVTLWSYYHGPIRPAVGRTIFTAWAIAILGQLGVLAWEIRRARRGRTSRPRASRRGPGSTQAPTDPDDTPDTSIRSR